MTEIAQIAQMAQIAQLTQQLQPISKQTAQIYNSSIKFIALDIYGTLLASDDSNNSAKPRRGYLDLFKRCDELSIKVVSASDANVEDVKSDLKASGCNIDRFHAFLRFSEYPKDFSQLTEFFKITPKQLFVVGDTYEKDIMGAMEIGAFYYHVPKYQLRVLGKRVKDEFNLKTVVAHLNNIIASPNE